MASKIESDDIHAIEAIIDRQFRSLEWSKERDCDWAKFTADFYVDATLYPAARPARPQTVDAFVERMKGLVGTSLVTFKERMLGNEIHVFGKVAVALGACEFTENGKDVSRGVVGFGAKWRCGRFEARLARRIEGGIVDLKAAGQEQ